MGLTTKTDSAKEPKLKESVNPDLLIAANKTVSGIIENAKQQVTEMNSKDEKYTANKSKQEQVKKMIDDFFKSDDEDDEEDDDDYDNDDNEPISVRMAICKKEEETSQSSNDKAVTPVLLEVAKETVSNVIDTAKVKVARINQEQGTNKSDQQIKTEKSIENVGATGLKTIISEVENTDESASIVKETQETKRVKGLGLEDLSKQKQVQTMITEALSPDGEEDQESEPIAVRMAICKKEDETTNEEADSVVSNVESGKLKDFKEESNGAIGLRSFLTEGKGSKPGEIETTVTDISKLTQVIIKGSLKLKVIKAKHLKNMDMVGKSDPYVSIQYGDKIVKSKKKKSTLNPEWNWETKIDLDDANSNIFFTVFDSDKIGQDEKMGSLTIRKETLNQFRSVNPTWLTFEDNMPGEVLVLFDLNDIQEITVPPTNNTTVKPVVSLEHREESKRDINITSNTVHKNTNKDQGAEGLKSFLEGDESKADIKDNSGKDQSIDPSKYSKQPTSPESNEGAIGLRKILNTDQSKTKIKEVGISIEESKMVPPKTTYLKDESVSTTSEEPVKTSEQLQKLPSKNENVANEDNKSAHKESSKPKVQQKLSESNEGAVLLIQESDNNENKKVPVSGKEAESTIPEINDEMKKRTQKESVQSESKDGVLGLEDILEKTNIEKVDGKLEDKLEKEKDNTKVQTEEVKQTSSKLVGNESEAHKEEKNGKNHSGNDDSTQGAQGLRNILHQPKVADGNISTDTSKSMDEYEGAIGLRKVLNKQEEQITKSDHGQGSTTALPEYPNKDTEKEKNNERKICHSNVEGITQIEVDNTVTVDTNREKVEADISVNNLKNMTDLIRRKLQDKSNQRNSDHGSRYSFSTITEVKTFQSTEEIKETISGDMLKTRSAIKKKRVVIIQQTIVTIVEYVSNWLDKVEYRISTVKKIKTVNQKKQELKSIKEEIEVIEETVDELVEVTEMAIEVIDDESKVTITSCVSCLRDQVKVVKLYHQQSEDELSDSEDKWEEYVEGINTIERLIKDLRKQVDVLENNDNISEEKVDTLEQFQMMNKGHMNKVVYLMATGNGLTAQLPENQIPDQVYTIYEKAKKIDNAIQKEKDVAVNLILSKDEYENTLAEYDEVVNIADNFIQSNLAVLDLSHFNEEIGRQKKFFINLSHCMQVLDSLEVNFSDSIKEHYSTVHDNLHKKSKKILESSARYINNLDEAFSTWSMINSEVSALSSELEIMKHRTSNLDKCTTDNYLEQIETLQRYELQLESLRIKTIIFQEKSKKLQQIVSSPAFRNLFTELDHQIPLILDSVRGDVKKFMIFRPLWKEYENIQTTIQPWLAMVETQLENDGRVDLIYSELKAYSNIHKEANDSFSTALETIQLGDEDMQRQLHSQFENRWKTLKDKLEKLISERKEIEFNNLLGFQDETTKLLEQSMMTTEIPLSSFNTNENLLAYIQKLSFLKVSLERRYKRISAIEIESKDFESVEQIGNLRLQLEQCLGKTAKKMELSVQTFEQLQAIKFMLENDELEIESTKIRLTNIKKESTNIGRTNKAKFLSIQDIKSRLVLDNRHLKIIEEDLKQLRLYNPDIAAAENLEIKFKLIENSLKELCQDAKETEIQAAEEESLWDDLNGKMRNMRSVIGETSFKLELSLARGHIDIKRLEVAANNIKALESDHLSHDQNLKDVSP